MDDRIATSSITTTSMITTGSKRLDNDYSVAINSIRSTKVQQSMRKEQL